MAYEQDIQRLEQIIAALDRRDLDLDEALRLFEEGVERLRAASSALRAAEAGIRQLVEQADGSLGLADFNR
jgi:exodeoxyribonuclease VII small subunit